MFGVRQTICTSLNFCQHSFIRIENIDNDAAVVFTFELCNDFGVDIFAPSKDMEFFLRSTAAGEKKGGRREC